MYKISLNILFVLSSLLGLAQQEHTLNKFSIKLNTSLANAEPLKYNGETVQINFKPQFGLSVGYECLPNLDAGIYLAFSNLTHMVDYEVEMVDGRVMSSSSQNIPSNAFYYGINLNYHLLPLLLKENNLRFDVYPIASAGFVSRSWTEFDGTEVRVMNYPEYHAGLGFGYKFSKYFGMYGEYTVGRFYNEGKSKASLGFLINF